MNSQGKYTFIFLLIFIFMIIGCSRKTLSIFFDGVPEESDSTMAANATPTNSVENDSQGQGAVDLAANTQSFHAPFSSKECAACHDKQSMGRYTASEPEMCYQCHDNFTNTYTILHAPVEAGSCTECHNPHQSQYPKLLKSDERAMCFSCHDYTEPNWMSIHEGIDNAKCSECHNPHGSHESGLLK